MIKALRERVRVLNQGHLPKAVEGGAWTLSDRRYIDEPSWRPDSFYEKVAANRQLGLHTLCLLDIKV
eukprot:COSAG02_NODE_18037_length_964_cov_3.404624_1_plen_66_part_10